MSEAATVAEREEPKEILVMDVARAFFEAPVKRWVAIELPQEDLAEGERAEELVGLLNMSLYGTRDAAANFQAEVKKFMEGAGFTQGKYNPCMYHQKEKDIKVLVH